VLNSKLFTKHFKVFVLKLSTMTCFYGSNNAVFLILNNLCKFLKGTKCFILSYQKQSPCISRKVIYNYKTIIVSTYAHGSRRSKQVHVKHFQRSSCKNKLFLFKRSFGLLSLLACFTYFVLLNLSLGKPITSSLDAILFKCCM